MSVAEAGSGRGGDPGGRRLWVYGFASTLAVVVWVAAAILPETMPGLVRQVLVVGLRPARSSVRLFLSATSHFATAVRKQPAARRPIFAPRNSWVYIRLKTRTHRAGCCRRSEKATNR